MNSLEIQLADAVVAWLEAGSYSKQATFERVYRLEETLEDGVKVPRIQVFPRTRSREWMNRGFTFDNRMGVALVLTAKLTAEEVADPKPAMDAYMRFRQELEDRLASTNAPGDNDFEFVDIETDPVYAEDHLVQLGQFTAALIATFRAVSDAETPET